MTSSFESLLTIPGFAPVPERPTRIPAPGRHRPYFFRSQERVATWHDLPFWPVLVYAWVAVAASFFFSLR